MSERPRLFRPLGPPISCGPSPNDVVAVDLDGDGALDLAFANHEASDLTVLLNGGKGRLTPMFGSPFTVRSKPHPHGIAAGDWNVDGRIDLAIESFADDRVELVTNEGDRFRSTVMLRVGDHPYQRLRSADIDRDGRMDLLTTNFAGGSVSVLLGRRTGLVEAQGSPSPPPRARLASRSLTSTATVTSMS